MRCPFVTFDRQLFPLRLPFSLNETSELLPLNQTCVTRKFFPFPDMSRSIFLPMSWSVFMVLCLLSRLLCVSTPRFIHWLVGRSVSWLVGWSHFIFLDASLHLYYRLCSLVGWLVGLLVSDALKTSKSCIQQIKQIQPSKSSIHLVVKK